ncbi:MAG: hypothetical protein J5I50_05815 [Chitinophagaceae bacterium]|nr:hypothetical protein [Chitinophagaceae bacterium]
MKKSTFFFIFVHLVIVSFSQSRDIKLQLRLPFQIENQKEQISNSLGTKELKANAVNFGIDALLNYSINKVDIHAGIGFFRNRFNLKREYDHRALNIGVDSLPIGTDAENYCYSLFRIPIGASYQVTNIKNTQVSVGAEQLFNFSFRRKYNGRVPFEGASTTYNGFTYFGNSSVLFVNFRSKHIEIEPYLRFYNQYKKDKFLKENENEKITRQLDAFGISIIYSFSL